MKSTMKTMNACQERQCFLNINSVNLVKKAVLFEQLSCNNMPQERSFCSHNSLNLFKKAVFLEPRERSPSLPLRASWSNLVKKVVLLNNDLVIICHKKDLFIHIILEIFSRKQCFLSSNRPQ